MTYTALQVSITAKRVITVIIIVTFGIGLWSCTLHEGSKVEPVGSSEENNIGIPKTSEDMSSNNEYKIPSDALKCYYLTAHDFYAFLHAKRTLEMLNNATETIIYFLPSKIDGYIISTLLPDDITIERDNVRIGGYNIGIEYYNILSDKREVSEIISAGLTESDIENVAIIEYEYNKPAASETPIAPGWHPSAVFWVHTTKGDYLLDDDYDYDDNGDIIHNWKVYTPEEYQWY
jgi:hypothetical protein